MLVVSRPAPTIVSGMPMVTDSGNSPAPTRTVSPALDSSTACWTVLQGSAWSVQSLIDWPAPSSPVVATYRLAGAALAGAAPSVNPAAAVMSDNDTIAADRRMVLA